MLSLVMQMFELQNITNITRYPAGEVQVELSSSPSFTDTPKVVSHCRDYDDIMVTALTYEVMKKEGMSPTIYIPYLPFSRHDRRNSPRDTIPLQFLFKTVLAPMLNDNALVTIDPHSELSAQVPYISQAELMRYRLQFMDIPDSLTILIQILELQKRLIPGSPCWSLKLQI